MEVKITAQLPFSWCQFCKRMDLTANRFIANGEVYETTNVCENAPICEACERARNEETETTLVIEPDESKRQIPTEAALRMQAMIDRYRQTGRERGI